MSNHRYAIDDELFERIEPYLEGSRGPSHARAENRRFIDAVLWVLRTGAGWRDLPERFGNGTASISDSIDSQRVIGGSISPENSVTLSPRSFS